MLKEIKFSNGIVSEMEVTRFEFESALALKGVTVTSRGKSSTGDWSAAFPAAASGRRWYLPLFECPRVIDAFDAVTTPVRKYSPPTEFSAAWVK